MTEKTYNKIRKYLKDIIAGSKFEGHVYCVGGCVRDSILKNEYWMYKNIEIKDIDLVVDLPNGGIEFANWVKDNGYSIGSVVVYQTYGTAMFKLNEFPNIELEVVQTRKEQYKDRNSRNPETCYGTLEEDCMRRDLTINALYWDITKERIIDLVEGVNDIKNGVIKTPTSPQVIFDDDPLRMLRVIRFATRYGWNIDDNTFNAIKKNADRIKIITQERINDEIIKTFKSRRSEDIIDYYKKSGLMRYILPELNREVNKCYNVKKRINGLMVIVNKENFEYVLFASLFHSLSLEEAEFVMRRMKLSKYVIENALSLIDFLKYRLIETNLNPEGIREMQYKYKDKDAFREHIYFLKEYEYWESPKAYFYHGNVIHTVCEYVEDNDTAMYDYELPVNGYDMMELGYEGKDIKEKLNIALSLAYKNPSITKEEIIEYLKSYK